MSTLGPCRESERGPGPARGLSPTSWVLERLVPRRRPSASRVRPRTTMTRSDSYASTRVAAEPTSRHQPTVCSSTERMSGLRTGAAEVPARPVRPPVSRGERCRPTCTGAPEEQSREPVQVTVLYRLSYSGRRNQAEGSWYCRSGESSGPWSPLEAGAGGGPIPVPHRLHSSRTGTRSDGRQAGRRF